MREPVGYLWTEKANGEKSLRFDPPADLPYNREHWEWEPVYVGNDDPACLPWPIDTDDQVEALARECDWDNRKYMTPKDYAIWCERMRKFVRLAAPSAPEGWLPIKTAPKNEMFIWAKRKADGLWSIGLAYQTVSGGWADSCGEPTDGAVLWHPLPSQPDLLNTTERR